MIVNTATATLATYFPNLAAYLVEYGFRLRKEADNLWSVVMTFEGDTHAVSLANDPEVTLANRTLEWLDRAARWDENDGEEGGF